MSQSSFTIWSSIFLSRRHDSNVYWKTLHWITVKPLIASLLFVSLFLRWGQPTSTVKEGTQICGLFSIEYLLQWYLVASTQSLWKAVSASPYSIMCFSDLLNKLVIKILGSYLIAYQKIYISLISFQQISRNNFDKILNSHRTCSAEGPPI